MPEPISTATVGGKLASIAAPFAGAVVMNLRRKRDQPWQQAVIGIFGGSVAGYLFADAVQAVLSPQAGTAGAVGFLCGYVALAICDAALDSLKRYDFVALLLGERRRAQDTKQ
jgi:hypothetical protein